MNNSHSPIEPNKTAIAIICRNPHIVWLEFLSGFKAYDTYVIIDDDSEDLSLLQSEYPNVQLIKIEPQACEEAGFTDTNSAHFNKVNGWDKALYYFAVENTLHRQVWFFEEDVFFYNEDTPNDIDRKYPSSDLLTAPYKISTSTSKDWWWWPMINIPFEQPYYNAMVCGLRVSGNLLDKIKIYAKQNGRLFFLEVLFSTLVIKNGLSYNTPNELKQIYFRYDWRYLSKTNVFHPIKNIESHPEIRLKLNASNTVYKLMFHITDIRTRWIAAIKERIRLMTPENLRKKKEVYKVENS